MKKYSVAEKRFYDEKGNICYFHGINVVDKGKYKNDHRKKCPLKKPDWRPREYKMNVTRTELEMLRSLGFNMIRLGFTWEAVEPDAGKYDEAFLDRLCNVIDDCSELGIKVLLDMHQDVYSGFGNGVGDGAPRWATMTGKKKYRNPLVVWAEGYFFSKAIANAFDNFWQNAEYNGRGLQDYYADCWAHIATRVKDKSAIFGYDLMNEPFSGSAGNKIFKIIVKKGARIIFKDKDFPRKKMLKGLFSIKNKKMFFDTISGEILKRATEPCDEIMIEFGQKYYTPFLNRVAERIRKVTDKGIITVDNNYFSNLGIKTGMDRITVKGKDEPLQCFAPHAYDFMIDTNQYNYASDERVISIFEEHALSSNRLNLPVIVGEWGGGCKKGTLWHEHIKTLLNYFDQKQWSHLYWSYGLLIFDDDVTTLLARAYVRSVFGELICQEYDYEKNQFKISFKIAEKRADNLVLYIPFAIDELPESQYAKISNLTTSEDVTNYKNTFKALLDEEKKKKGGKNIKQKGKIDMLPFATAKVVKYSLPIGEYEFIIGKSEK